MKRQLFVMGLAVSCALVLVVLALRSVRVVKAENEPTTAKISPAEGYTVHVLAPHVVDGHAMGPYHHYCKVLAPDPVIQCLIYDSTDANARLSEVEFIVAKKLTRNQVSLKDWNANWHDHTIEIAGGRVQVLDLPPDKAKEVADLVSTTDGLIVHIYYDGDLPNGRTSVAQAVGHKPMSESEFKNYASK
jgi:Protein of unknown function (DUF1264)